jgi:transglutaminase-like putative cysteine protease
MPRDAGARMVYDITIRFAYAYTARTAWGYHLVRLRPRDTAAQRVLGARLAVEPVPAQISTEQDFFGNDRTILLQEMPHDRMTITMSAAVEVTRAPLELDLTPCWREVAALAFAHADIGPQAPGHFLGSSPLVPLDETITAFARQEVDATMSVFAVALGVMKAVHARMSYVPKVTQPHTRASEAFRLGKGVCQDFAHVMIAALRGLGLPAAYASGLIRTIPPPGQPRLEGADAMHAWVQVWCGEATGWIGFDPTNALVVANDHVLVAIGRDYADVAPVDGVIVAATRELKHAVDMVPRM